MLCCRDASTDFCMPNNGYAVSKMTDEELIAYNSTVPLEQNVICFKDLRTDSHIRKTRCMTIMDILTEAETNARTIDALNIGPQLF